MSRPIQEGDMVRYRYMGSSHWECCTVRRMPGLTGLYLGTASQPPINIADPTLVTGIERLVPEGKGKLREALERLLADWCSDSFKGMADATDGTTALLRCRIDLARQLYANGEEPRE